MSYPEPPREPAPEQQPPQDRAARSCGQKVQDQLDEALADSFPASDPVSIVTSHAEDWDQENAS